MSTNLVGGMCSLCCHMALVLAFMHLYSIFNLRLLLSILFVIYFFNLVLKRQTEMVKWYQHLRTLYTCMFSTRVIPIKVSDFRIMFVCFTFTKCACFVLYSNCVRNWNL